MDFGFIDTITICSWATAFIKVLPIVLPVVLLVSLLWKEWRKKVIYTITRKTSLLKVIYFVVSFIIGFALIVLFSLLYVQIISIQCGATQTELNVQNLALAFLGTVSGIAALFGVFLAIQRTDESKLTNKITIRQNEIANRQANTAEQESITARIDRATEGLGKKDGKIPIIEARVGALISLEQIAQDNIRYHISVMETLCAYVRYNSPKDDGGKEQGHLREDLQTAITIIGRRDRWQDGKKHLEKEIKQKYKIDLCKCNLRRADFADANLSNASLIGANLRGASFISAELSYAWLDSANFKGAELHKAYAHETDFSECENFTQEQVNQMFCGIGVIIPENLTRPEHWPTDKMSWDKFYSLYKEWIK